VDLEHPKNSRVLDMTHDSRPLPGYSKLELVYPVYDFFLAQEHDLPTLLLSAKPLVDRLSSFVLED